MTALISVIMPVFNGGKTIRGAVRSILDQTYPHFELLILDDGSIDETVAIVRQFNDPRISLKGDTARRGLATRLNEGIDLASGEFIARMDADDISFPERFEKQIEFLSLHPDIDLLGTRAIVFRSKDDLVGLHPFAKDHEALCGRTWRGIPLPHPTWMGRAAWFRSFRYAVPEVMRAEDQDLLLRSYEKSRFACLSETLLAYRQGHFEFAKTMTARRYLLGAQLRYFKSHRRRKNACLSVLAFILKIGFDVIASVPGCRQFFFMRMAEEIPRNVKARFNAAVEASEKP